ncbi:hypothetical protein GQ457_08G035670 [Hibiscus cannabinus]
MFFLNEYYRLDGGLEVIRADGRRIRVGDCALFKPALDSLPVVGIIRCLITGKEYKSKLVVNWLYRPAELKPGKGTLLEAAPNEIFYSFHKDEIPAASLLHPYYITVHREVEHLLCNARLEMHEAVQPGGCSPKSIKPGLESASSFLLHGKGNKRECVDQGSEPVKREWMEGILIMLMMPERTVKIDLVRRSILARVIATTDKFDCLNLFVQLRGLPIYDMWLQEVHKRMIGDNRCSKDDRSVDDFLLTVLRALDKLLVNLTALQMCNIGKSVNHLRSHKNIEIQKKARTRSLVDTWKKQFEAEMDAKSGSSQNVPWYANLVYLKHLKHCASPEGHRVFRGKSYQAKILRFTGLLLLKKYQSGLTCEKATYSHMAEVTTGHKFVVKVPNSGRSSAQSTSGGSPYGYLAMNRSSHVLSEKREQLDRKSGTYQENVVTDESLLRNDFKYVLTGYDEGDGSAAAVPDEENCQTKEDARKSTNVTKTAFSSSGNELKSERLWEASFSSMNALIKSCAKYSKVDVCIPVEDDAGMNLLASVAAEEISKSDVALPIDSPQRNTPVENSSPCNDTVLKYSAGDEVIRDPNQFIEGAEDEHIKQGVIDIAYQFLENGKLKEIMTGALVNSSSVSIVKMITGIGDSKEHLEKKAVGGDDDADLDSKHKGSISMVNEVVMSTVLDVEHKKNIPGSFDGSSESHQKAPAVIGHSTNGTDKEALPLSSKDTILENVDEKVETGACCHASHSEKQRPEWESKAYALNVETGACCHASHSEKQRPEWERDLEGNEDHELEAPSPCKASATVRETELPLRPRGSKLTDAKADEHASTNTDAPATDAKVEIDLNEGFNYEGKFDETSRPGTTSGEQSRPPLDIDLNSPDERVLEDLASQSSSQGKD